MFRFSQTIFKFNYRNIDADLKNCQIGPKHVA
jgi:hypothetical protein